MSSNTDIPIRRKRPILDAATRPITTAKADTYSMPSLKKVKNTEFLGGCLEVNGTLLRCSLSVCKPLPYPSENLCRFVKALPALAENLKTRAITESQALFGKVMAFEVVNEAIQHQSLSKI